jgi:ribose 5-phosphate isomerase B
MRIAVGSDERTHVTDAVVEELRRRGHHVETLGALSDLPARQAGKPLQWADVAREVAERVAGGASDQGVLFCWTGTGVSIAANKVPGVRAALCHDAETARGARLWNDANVLCLSLRSTSEAVAREILEAWLSTDAPDPSEAENIARLRQMDARRSAGAYR